MFSNLRTSVLVCIPSAGSKSTIIHTFISFMVSVRPWSQTCPIRNTEFERAFVIICGGSNINFTRNDQTKCPAKWDKISIENRSHNCSTLCQRNGIGICSKTAPNDQSRTDWKWSMLFDQTGSWLFRCGYAQCGLEKRIPHWTKRFCQQP